MFGDFQGSEIPEPGDSNASKVATGTGTVPLLGTRHARRATLGQNVKQSGRLLAGGTRIHVDFHADRHFDDFWCFPGHFGFSLQMDELPPCPLN